MHDELLHEKVLQRDDVSLLKVFVETDKSCEDVEPRYLIVFYMKSKICIAVSCSV